MAKFVITNKVPEELDKDCIVIEAPTFMPEIEASINKKPRSKELTPNYLRAVIGLIGAKYADENFSALTSVNVSRFKGVPCEDNKRIEEVLFKIFAESYPEMFDKYVEYHIKSRPHGTKLIYFLGNFNQSSKFFEHGIDQIKDKDIPVYLGNKKKKIVGKPAITAEEAAKNSENVV